MAAKHRRAHRIPRQYLYSIIHYLMTSTTTLRLHRGERRRGEIQISCKKRTKTHQTKPFCFWIFCSVERARPLGQRKTKRSS